MYYLKSKDVGAGRFELFEKAFGNKNPSDAILKNKLKSFDASSMPPSKQ